MAVRYLSSDLVLGEREGHENSISTNGRMIATVSIYNGHAMSLLWVLRSIASANAEAARLPGNLSSIY